VSKAIIIAVLSVAAGCVTPAITGKEQSTASVGHIYSANPNQVYYAIRWALAAAGYPVGHEDLANGRISTTWVPTTPQSHYLAPFDRGDPDTRDFGNLAGYYKLDLQVQPESDKTRVIVTSHVRSIVNLINSSGLQEEDVLKKIGNYLRSDDPTVTNLGIK
jgi:hypothetical protein